MINRSTRLKSLALDNKVISILKLLYSLKYPKFILLYIYNTRFRALFLRDNFMYIYILT